MCCDRRGDVVVPCPPPHPSQRVGPSAPETDHAPTTTSTGETMSDRDETVIAEAMLNMPSPIAAEEFEPGFWRSCATWEQIVEKATPAILAALKANRIALIELAETQTDPEWGDEFWQVSSSDSNYPGKLRIETGYRDGVPRISMTSIRTPMPITEVDAYVSALLAAKAAAEVSW
ncbi:DNA methyltransferase [Mycobacterium phage Purky]|uniref:Uncharacterized protein n=1 Tax=Mycobacterium phage Purky TaxID=2593351 RepID=A0A514TWV3_9CAUD|nr:DNA methyltransferase [Mycobacterium phage Purky]QDK01165.1 hypothetical protein SEA_PURKY_61 [Mycobacterium phage Purky]